VSELPTGTVTFLFTDIEGSTALLKQLGDEYANVLDDQRRLLREAFAAQGGREIDTQGDSFFFVFARAKNAIVAAIDAQRALVAHEWPEGAVVRVRMGLHSGEPLVGEDRYVGIGVNRAARVGAVAHGGQVLVSDVTRALVEDDLPAGVFLRDLGLWQLKDIDRPERVSQVVTEGLPSEFPRLRGAEPVRKPPLRRLSVLAAVLVAAVAVAVPVFALSSGGSGGATGGIVRVSPGSVGVLDARTNRFVRQVSVPGRPSLVAAAGPLAWVANDQSPTVTPVSLGRLSPGSAVVPGITPTDMAASSGALWILDATHRKLVRIISSYGTPDPAISLPPTSHPTKSGALAVGAGRVWVTDGSTDLWRRDIARTSWAKIPVGVPVTDVAVGDGAVWVISPSKAEVLEIGTGSGKVEAHIAIAAHGGLSKPLPFAVAVGPSGVWVLNQNDASVSRIDPNLQVVTATIQLGAARLPSSIAAGADAAWVANSGDGTLARIDARTNALTSIDVGSTPVGVAVAGNRVLVSVQPGFVATTSAVGGSTIASVKGALPASFCSPVYFQGKGRPRVLIAADLPLTVPLTDTIPYQVSEAIRFMLAKANYKAGAYTVGYQACDDATAPDGFFSDAACRRNARAYVNSPILVGVIGPFNSGCVEQALPILNQARNGPVAAISGSATTAGLTRAGPGAAPGEPARLYPTGVRNFARVIANDATQAAADVILAKQLGSKRLYILNDGFPPYGPGIAADARQAARTLNLTVAGYRSWNAAANHYLALAAQIKHTHADTVILGGTGDANGDTLIRDLRAILGPRFNIIAPDGFLINLAPLTGPAAEGLYGSFPTTPTNRLPRAGKRFVSSFRRAIGSPVEDYSVTSAQAAQVLLNAIAASNGTRASITNHLLHAKITNGILGSFHFDPKGDTTSGNVAIYQIVGGRLILRRTIQPPPSLFNR
jgi:class 3 adenylate cyclase/ABC-type branched-subunit amino acid transport system substrate-binding protein